MTNKTRSFLVASAAVLAVGLGTGLIASYFGVPTLSRWTARGPEELRYLPKDASVVAYANVRDVMQSELRQRMRKLERHDQRGREDFQEKTGINIETDIDRVVACLTRRGTDRQDGGLVLARGRFDEVRIEGLVREHGGTVEQYKSKRLIATTESGDDHTDGKDRKAHSKGPMALVFLEPGLVAFGSR